MELFFVFLVIFLHEGLFPSYTKFYIILQKKLHILIFIGFIIYFFIDQFNNKRKNIKMYFLEEYAKNEIKCN